MTERLYYTDSYRTHFSSPVIERLTWQGKPAVVLQHTAFYPNSGGQPADTGTLDGVRVLDVIEREEDGAIIHVLSEPLLDGPRSQEVEADIAPGAADDAISTAHRVSGSMPPASGTIDWPRRFDHMQQHTGQHILSAAFEKVLDLDTVGFHLGTEESTVDIEVAPLDPEAVIPVEELANQIVWEDRPVNTYFANSDDLDTLSLRRPPAVEGPVRIIEVSEFDTNPCGGTHVARTGEIGLIKITGLESRGDVTRVEFLCGNRALRDYRAKNGVIRELARNLTVGYWELDQAVARLQAEAKQTRRELRQARERLRNVEAHELVEAAEVYGSCRVVSKVWAGRKPGDIRALAQELSHFPGVIALLVSVDERTHLCFTRAEEVELDVSAWLLEACAQMGGKGGGRPNIAQGSAPAADIAQVEQVITNLTQNIVANIANF